MPMGPETNSGRKFFRESSSRCRCTAPERPIRGLDTRRFQAAPDTQRTLDRDDIVACVKALVELRGIHAEHLEIVQGELLDIKQELAQQQKGNANLKRELSKAQSRSSTDIE